MVKVVSGKEHIAYTPEYYTTEAGAEDAPVYLLKVPTVFDKARVKRELAKHGVANLSMSPILDAAKAGFALAERELGKTKFNAEKALEVFRDELPETLKPGYTKSEAFANLENMLSDYLPYKTAVADFVFVWEVMPLVLCQMFVAEVAKFGVKAFGGMLTDDQLGAIPAQDLVLVGLHVWSLLYVGEAEKKD